MPEITDQFAFGHCKQYGHFGRLRIFDDLRAFGQRFQFSLEAIRRVYEYDGAIPTDAELFRERRAGVAGGRTGDCGLLWCALDLRSFADGASAPHKLTHT